MTTTKIALPLLLFFLMGIASAYTPIYNDIAGTTVDMILTFVITLIPFWAVFVVAVVILVIIKSLGG